MLFPTIAGADAGGPGRGMLRRSRPVSASITWSCNPNVSGTYTTPLPYVGAPYVGTVNGDRHKILPVAASIAAREDILPGSCASDESIEGPVGESKGSLSGVGNAIVAKMAGLPLTAPTAGVAS